MPFYPIFSTPLITALFLVLTLAAALAVMEHLVARGAISKTASRRLVHVLAGSAIFSCRFIFEQPTYPVLVALLFLAINLLTLRKGLLASIHGIAGKSYGTVFFPLAYAALALLFWTRDPVALQTGVLLLTVADPLAGWVGQTWGRRTFALWAENKTLPGSVAMFSAAALIWAASGGLLLPLAGLPAWTATQLALGVPLGAAVVTIAEIHSRAGSDNLTVPLAGTLFMALFAALPADSFTGLALWSTGSGVLLAGAVWLPALSRSGMLGAWVMGLFIFLAGGWTWLLPIIVFFVASSLLSLARRAAKAGPTVRRDLRQVFANGGPAMAAAIVFGISGPMGWQIEGLYSVFLAALAAATADTWATEIGKWSRTPPRNIITGEVVVPGTSGGVTWLGTAGSLAGAALLAITGRLLAPELLSASQAAVVLLIGFGAALVDSLLGATLQARFTSPGTGPSEDRPADMSAVTVTGWGWLDNNMVNLTHGSLAALLALAWLAWYH